MGYDSEAKPDFAQGVPIASVREDEIVAGVVGDAPVLLTRVDGRVVAYGGECPHLKAPLGKGLCSGGILRCPWHHARFDLRTGAAVAAPAFDPLPVWHVEEIGEKVYVRSEEPRARQLTPAPGDAAEPGLVIVGGGAAGYAAAHEIRRRGHTGTVTMVSDDPHPPYDRTLLSKDYLDGKFGDDHLPIARHSLDDLRVTRVPAAAEKLDTAAHRLTLSDGSSVAYTKLLLATGAEPSQLDIPGADLPHVHPLRTLDDCGAIIDDLAPGAAVVVVGSSFIGLEAAASVRSRGFDVTVVSPDDAPMARILGRDLSDAIVAKHLAKGVVLRLGLKPTVISPGAVTLSDGIHVPADLIIVGIGVAPRLDLAKAAGLWCEDGVMVDLTLRTSDPDIFAAGDIARWPDIRSDGPIRVEHWVVAERQGTIAAANMLDADLPYTEVPFFWSKHFDLSFRYVGHAERWDDIAIEGDIEAGKAVLRYRTAGRDRAVVTVGNDTAAMEAEVQMESETRPG